MQRRTFLTSTVTTCSLLAGCTSLDTRNNHSRPTTDHTTDGSLIRPWESLPVTVTTTGRHDLVPDHRNRVQTALDYWETNDQQYLGYEITFTYTPDNPNADIITHFTENITACGDSDHERLVGCAPLLGDRRVQSSVDVRIETEQNPDDITRTLKHEFGHVLGLTHEDAPKQIMSNDPADQIENYEQKQVIIDAYNEGIRTYNEGINMQSTATDYWDNTEYASAADTFREAVPLFESAATSFSTAATKAREIKHWQVTDWSVAAKKKCQYYADASEHISEASDAYEEGDRSRGKDAYDAYETAHEKANQYTITDSGVIIDALGL